MRRRFRPLRASTALVVLVLVAWAAFRLWQIWPDRGPPEALPEGLYEVSRVVDGDTLLLTNRTRVRLIGVDTPETVKPHEAVQPWGPEATAFTADFIGRGTVRLQLDRERVDRHGRFLAYVWVDDRMLNEELLRAGLAQWEPQYHYSDSMKTRFRKAQQEAQQAQRGIWSQAAIPAEGGTP